MKQGIFFDWQSLVQDTKTYLASQPKKTVEGSPETVNFFKPGAKPPQAEKTLPALKMLPLPPPKPLKPLPPPAPVAQPQKPQAAPAQPKIEEKKKTAEPHRAFPYMPHDVPQATPANTAECAALMAKYLPGIKLIEPLDDSESRAKESAWKKNYTPIVALSFFDSKSPKEEFFGTMVRAIGEKIAPVTFVRVPTKALALELAVLSETGPLRSIILAYDMACVSRVNEFISYFGLEAVPPSATFFCRCEMRACRLFDLVIADGLGENGEEKRALWKQFQSHFA